MAAKETKDDDICKGYVGGGDRACEAMQLHISAISVYFYITVQCLIWPRK